MVMKIHHYSIPAPHFGSALDTHNLFGNLVEYPLLARVQAYPHLDVAEYDDRTEIVAELPGVAKEDIRISLHDVVLTLNGIRKQNAIPENAGWVRNEIRSGEFARSITLPHEVKIDAVAAELTNGILRITLPKADEARVREIAIR